MVKRGGELIYFVFLYPKRGGLLERYSTSNPNCCAEWLYYYLK
jgi:hypothetical protein